MFCLQNSEHLAVFAMQSERIQSYSVNRFRTMNPNLAINLVKDPNTRRLVNACASNNSQQLEAVDSYGNTALLKACHLGNAEAVRVLLSFHVNLHAINYYGQNALTLATYAGSYDAVCELLKYRSYIDFTLSSMIPPLCVATLKGYRHLVRLFQNLHPQENCVRTVHGLTAADLQIMLNLK